MLNLFVCMCVCVCVCVGGGGGGGGGVYVTVLLIYSVNCQNLSKYHISMIKYRGYYLFHQTIFCGYYSRAATNQRWCLLNSA